MLVNAFVPRLSMAFACAWVLPAVYGAHLFFTGSFGLQKALALGLLLASVAVGAIFPRFGLGVLSSAMGSLLLVAALPFKANFWWPLAVACGGILWQTLVLPRLHRPRVTSVPPPPPNLADKRRMWLGASSWGAAVARAPPPRGGGRGARGRCRLVAQPETPGGPRKVGRPRPARASCSPRRTPTTSSAVPSPWPSSGRAARSSTASFCPSWDAAPRER